MKITNLDTTESAEKALELTREILTTLPIFWDLLLSSVLPEGIVLLSYDEFCHQYDIFSAAEKEFNPIVWDDPFLKARQKLPRCSMIVKTNQSHQIRAAWDTSIDNGTVFRWRLIRAIAAASYLGSEDLRLISAEVMEIDEEGILLPKVLGEFVDCFDDYCRIFYCNFGSSAANDMKEIHEILGAYLEQGTLNLSS